MNGRLVIVALVVAGCAQDPGDKTTQATGPAPVAPPAGEVSACASVPLTGTVLRAQALRQASVYAPVDMAVDPLGDPLQGLQPSEIYPDPSATPRGLTKMAPDSTVLFQKVFGDQVTSDALGNIYVSGVIFGPTDFGFGVVTPDNDGPWTYVVKMAPDGTSQWAKLIGQCGDLQMTGLAVAADGRIAVSGDRLGTYMLDNDGNELWSRPIFGDVAFDSHDDLVINGTQAGDWVIEKLDASASVKFRITLGDRPGTDANYPQAGANVAIDANDNILVSGTSDWHGIDMFGHQWASGPDYGGEIAFVVKLANDGALDWFVGTGSVTATGLAVDAQGNALFSGSWYTGFWPSYHKPWLLKLAADNGDLIWAANGPAYNAGNAWGVATDRCGTAYWTVTVRDQLDAGANYDNYVLTVAP